MSSGDLRYRQSGGETALLALLSLLFPPLAVGLADRAFSGSVCLNIVLTFCGWFPGVVHALFWCFFRGARGPKARDTGVPFTSQPQYQGQQPQYQGQQPQYQSQQSAPDYGQTKM